ncbi:MAG: site-specific integrase [Pseudomonadota bacterium]
MPSVYVFKRKRKRPDGTEYREKTFTAQITFGRKRRFLRSTGKTTEREARIEAKELAKVIAREEIPKLGKQYLTISQLFGRWWEEYGHEMRTADTAMYRVKNILSYFDENLFITDLNNALINDYIQHRKKDSKTPATINRELFLLKGALKRAKQRWNEEVPDINWTDHMQKEPREREIIVSPEEIKKVLLILPYHIRLAAAWTVYTGCRLNETETLEKSKIYFDQKIAQVMTKGGGTRIVAMSSKAIDVARLSCEVSETEYAFYLKNRRRVWEAARKEINRPDIRWHDLRHVTGSWLRQYANSDLKEIGRALGHSELSSTIRYVHLATSNVIEALEKLPKVI